MQPARHPSWEGRRAVAVRAQLAGASVPFLTCLVEARFRSITALGCVFTDLVLSPFAQSLLLQRDSPRQAGARSLCGLQQVRTVIVLKRNI